MQKLVLFAGVMVSAMWMLGAAPLDLSTEDSSALSSEELPEQTQCPDLTALPYKPRNMPGSTTFRLFVGRLMSSPYTPVVDPAIPNNLCSPLTYAADSCGGMEIYVRINEDGSKVVKMGSYSTTTNNVMCYTQSAELQDQHYHIFKAQVNQMVLINENGEPSVVETIPKTVTDIDDTMIVTLQYGENLSYAIYATCDRSVAWVSYAEHVVKENLIDGLKEEIDEELTELGFDPTRFVNVPISIPINLDRCFTDAETVVPVSV